MIIFPWNIDVPETACLRAGDRRLCSHCKYLWPSIQQTHYKFCALNEPLAVTSNITSIPSPPRHSKNLYTCSQLLFLLLQTTTTTSGSTSSSSTTTTGTGAATARTTASTTSTTGTTTTTSGTNTTVLVLLSTTCCCCCCDDDDDEY